MESDVLLDGSGELLNGAFAGSLTGEDKRGDGDEE